MLNMRGHLLEDEGSSVFGGTVTLDPNKVVWCWDRLGQDAWALQFMSVPHVMHRALLHTLKERGWAK